MSGFARCPDSNLYYLKQVGGEWVQGTIIGDGSVEVISFAEDKNVSFAEYSAVDCNGSNTPPVMFLGVNGTRLSSVGVQRELL